MINPWQAPSYGSEYSSNLNSAIQSQANAYAGQDQSQMTLQNMQNQQNQMTSDYPAMQNAYGLGSQIQTQPIPGNASNPDYATEPITVTVPDTASRGFNPWSLTGEANARGK